MNKFGKLSRIGAMVLAAGLGIGSVTLLAQIWGGTDSPEQKTIGEKRAGRGEHSKGFGKDRRGGRRHMGGRMFAGLDLDDAQKARIEQIRETSRQDTQLLREQLEAKGQEVRAAQSGRSFDEVLVTQRLTEMAGLEAKLMGEHSKLQQEILGVLTPEQKTKFEEAQARRGEHRGMDRTMRGAKALSN